MHQMGSCRMGSSPQNSVTDGQGHCWDVAGLYVADASCFPTASGPVTNSWLFPSLCCSHNRKVAGRQTYAVAHAQWHQLYSIYACDSFMLLKHKLLYNAMLLLAYATIMLLCRPNHVLVAAW